MSLPIPNLDDKTFDELFEEARSLIPRYAPAWTDHNFSDPGITFIDLFAWLAEMQMYRLNRINDQHKLKFLKLLGTTPDAATPATVDVTFQAHGKKNLPVVRREGTRLAAVDPDTGEDLWFETNEPLSIHDLNVARVLTYDASDWVEHTSSNTPTGGFYFAFGNQPAPPAALYLGFETAGAFPSGDITLTIDVYSDDLPPVTDRSGGRHPATLFPSAELDWQFWDGASWRSLVLRQDDTVALTQSGRLMFEGPAQIQRERLEVIENSMFSARPSEPLYWLRAQVKTAGYEIPPRLDTVLTNTISASQGQTILDEFLVVKSLPRQTVRLRHGPVLPQTVALKLLEEDGTYHAWQEVFDFDASGPHDRHYTLDLRQGLIHFGDGIRGRIPPPVAAAAYGDRGNVWMRRYRAGGGANGNVVAHSINRILDGDASALSVVNHRAALGGTPAESPDEALHRIRKGLKAPSRAVSASDVEHLTRATPGLRVARAKALALYHPAYPGMRLPGAMTVVVVPYTLPDLRPHMLPIPSSGFLRTIDRFLQTRRLIGTQLHVVGPVFIRVDVEASVEVDPRYDTEQIDMAFKKALTTFLDPLTGGKDGTGWAFGRAVFKSEIYQVVAAVAGVLCIHRVTLKGSEGCHLTDQGDIRLPRIGLAYSGAHQMTIDTKQSTVSKTR